MNLGSIFNLVTFASMSASIVILHRLVRLRHRSNLSGPIVYFISEIIGNILVLLSSLSLSVQHKLFFFNYLFAFFVMGSCGWFIWMESFVKQKKGISRLGWFLLGIPLIIFLYTTYLTITHTVPCLLVEPRVEQHYGYPFLVFNGFTPTAMIFVAANLINVFLLLVIGLFNFRALKRIKKKYYIFSFAFSLMFFLFITLYFTVGATRFPFISIFDVALFAMMFIKIIILYNPHGSVAVNLNMMDRYTLLEKMQQGFFAVDSQGEVLDYNQVGKNILAELGHAQINSGENFFTVFTAIFPDFTFNPKQFALNQFTEIEQVLEFTTKDAKYFFEVELELIADTKEKGTKEDKFLIFIRDITSAKAQQLDSIIFKTAFYAMDDMMLICDPNGLIEYASCGFCNKTGYTEAEIKGRSFLEFKYDDDDNVFKAITKSLTNKECWDGYIRGMQKNGKELLEKITISPIFDTDKKQVGLAVVSKDITVEHTQIEQLEREAGEDFLTQISNRRTFMYLAATKIEQAVKKKQSIALLMMDIDFFKLINGTYGHDAGDAALRQLADLIKNLIRKDDLFARYGGEEFILLVTGMNEDQLLRLSGRIRGEAEKMIINWNKHSIHFTVSIGVCFAVPNETVQISELIHNADQALYRAKNLGRNKVVFWQA